MPDMEIDPSALSRTGSGSQPPSTSTAPSKTVTTSTPGSQKVTKVVSTAPRIDLEPFYTGLKSAVSEHWPTYIEAVSLFLLGHLDQDELSDRVDSFITIDPHREHLHNQLINGIICNLVRDMPDQGVASWVSANDKPASVSKPIAGDAAEQRLKAEVMQLPARDRRRIKDIADTDTAEIGVPSLTEYHQAMQIKLPDSVPASAGGLNKTNWDLEIRKRYIQPLASETFELPDLDNIQARLLPICYELGVVGGAADSCSSFLDVALQTYIKEVLTSTFQRVRSNRPGYIMTARYKRQLEKEEEAWLREEVVKNERGLLPVEQLSQQGHKGLAPEDLALSITMGDEQLSQMPTIIDRVFGRINVEELDDWNIDELTMELNHLQINGDVVMLDGIDGLDGTQDDPFLLGEGDRGWEGGGEAERDVLAGLLDDCLAISQ